MMAFIGVRISWLMLARKALLAWLACSARSRSRVSASFSSIRRRSDCRAGVTSTATPK